MLRYTIRYNPEAEEDLAGSFEWGVEKWGLDAAIRWYDFMEAAIGERLSNFPLSCPIAPEDQAFDYEVRHLILGRYRVLFCLVRDEVIVIHIRGPFVDDEG
jgi:plasmid stabilization system protein ParE